MGVRRRVVLTGIETAYLSTLAGPYRRFLRAASKPWATQAAILARFLERHAGSAYGRAHGFDRIRTPSELQDRVPIVSYEDLRPYVDRIAAGEPNVLGPEPVRVLERTSGSSGGDKLIPYTAEMFAEVSRATGPWIFDMYAARPHMIGTTSYWSLSPAARPEETTAGGIPIGIRDDTEYFGRAARFALSRMMAVPSDVGRIRDIDRWRTETARHLAASKDLGFISVWSPSFLTLLMRAIEREIGAPEEGPLWRSLWPRLSLISCWTDGHAKDFVAEMAAAFPGVEIAGKGLLATEGVVSIPLGGARPLAVTSHFLELEDIERPKARPLFADQLRRGGRYAPILTTGNGFARYRLSDEIECTGFFSATPSIRFVGKRDRVSDLCGEKITAVEVDRAIDRAARRAGRAIGFALIAPRHGSPPRYELYFEGAALPSEAVLEIEAAFLENHHYRYCRDLGQLGPVSAVRVENGWQIFEREMVSRGTKAGDVKPTHLDGRPNWHLVFGRAS
jgi:hypothetical protein